MTRSRALVIAAAVLATVIGVYFAFFGASDDQKIRDVLQRLTVASRLHADDGVSRVARVRGEFAEIFDHDVQVSVADLPAIAPGRAGIADTVIAAPGYFRDAEVTFGSIDVKIDDAKITAQVSANAALHATAHDGSSRSDKRAATFLFRKVDGKWIIESLRVWARESNGE